MAGTVTSGRLEELPPIITPVLLEPEPCPPELDLPVVRISRARERANWRDDDGAVALELFDVLVLLLPLNYMHTNNMNNLRFILIFKQFLQKFMCAF